MLRVTRTEAEAYSSVTKVHAQVHSINLKCVRELPVNEFRAIRWQAWMPANTRKNSQTNRSAMGTILDPRYFSYLNISTFNRVEQMLLLNYEPPEVVSRVYILRHSCMKAF